MASMVNFLSSLGDKLGGLYGHQNHPSGPSGGPERNNPFLDELLRKRREEQALLSQPSVASQSPTQMMTPIGGTQQQLVGNPLHDAYTKAWINGLVNLQR